MRARSTCYCNAPEAWWVFVCNHGGQYCPNSKTEKEMSEEVNRRRDHVLDRPVRGATLSYLKSRTIQGRQGNRGLKNVWKMKKLQFDDDIDTTQSPPYWFLSTSECARGLGLINSDMLRWIHKHLTTNKLYPKPQSAYRDSTAQKPPCYEWKTTYCSIWTSNVSLYSYF